MSAFAIVLPLKTAVAVGIAVELEVCRRSFEVFTVQQMGLKRDLRGWVASVRSGCRMNRSSCYRGFGGEFSKLYAVMHQTIIKHLYELASSIDWI